MTYVDSLVTRFQLDSGGYTSNAQKATAATNQFSTAAKRAAAAQKNLNQAVSQGSSAMSKAGSFGKPNTTRSGTFGSGRPGVRTSKVAGTGPFDVLSKGLDNVSDSAKSAFDSLSPLKRVIGTIVGVGAVGAAAGYGLMRQAAEFDSLRQSLIAVEGDAKKAGAALGRLKNLAKAPGLGFEEAVGGYSGLRNAGVGQDFAERIIKEFANANARGGGNAETFGRILTQLRQAISKGKLQQEDLSPIAEAGVPINKILKDAFGTADTEELAKKGIGAEAALKGIVDQLAKLPRVAGGARNEFDNLEDALKFAGVAAGESLNNAFLPLFTDVAEAVSKLTENGSIASAFEGIANNVIAILDRGGEGIEKALKDFLVGLQTASGGARNLAGNAEGFAEFVKNSPFGRLASGAFNAANRALGDDFDYSFEAERKRIQDVQAAEEAKNYAQERNRKEKAAKGQKPDGTPLDNPKTDPSLPVLDSISKSNQKLVALQQKELDIRTQLLGGSTLAQGVTGEYGLRKTLRGRGGSVRGMLMDLADHFEGLQGAQQVQGRLGRQV